MSLRKRSLYFALVIALTVLTGFTHITHVDATEPSDMMLVYDFGAQTLTVNVSHYVANTKTHYIENIEVLKNGLSKLNRSYVNQSLNYGTLDTFSVSAVVDDNLTVTASCNKGYSLSRWLIVTSTTATNTPPTETTPTTEPTDGTESPGTPLGAGPAIAAGIIVVVFFIVFFAWLNPERVPESLKQLGSRIRAGFTRFGEKVGNLLNQIKTRSPS